MPRMGRIRNLGAVMELTEKKLLWKATEVAHHLSITYNTFRVRRKKGIYPEPVNDCGGNRWRRADIEEYVNNLGRTE